MPLGAHGLADLAALQASGETYGQTAAWSTGWYVLLADHNPAYWDGTGWQAGTAP